MGVARLLIVGALVGVAAAAQAVCEPAVEGLAVAEARGRLEVAAVAGGSPAAAAGFAEGDTVRQVNGTQPTECKAWQAEVSKAFQAGLGVLVLVQHARERRLVAVWPMTAPVAVAAPSVPPASSLTPAPVPAEPTEPAPPPRRVATEPVELLPDAVPVTRTDVLAGIGALGPANRTRLRPYRDEVEEVRRRLSTLLVRDPGTVDADRLLRIVRYHEGAVIAWDAVEDIRRRQRLRASSPVSVGATASFFVDSDVAELLSEVPLLTGAVRRWPGTGAIQRAGLWEPMRARAILWDAADALVVELVGEDRRD